MNTKLLIFLFIVFLSILYVLVKSKSLILFGFFLSLILSLCFLYIFTFIKGYQNRILKFLIFTFYAISAVLFSNVEDNKYLSGVNNSIFSYYLWSLGFVTIIIACLYPKNYKEAKNNFYIRSLVFLNLFIFSMYALYGIIEYIGNRYSKTKIFCLDKSNYDSNIDEIYCYGLKKILGEDFERIDRSKKSFLRNIFGDDKEDETSNVKFMIVLLIFIIFLALIASKFENIFNKIKADKFSYLNIIYLFVIYVPCLFLDGFRFLNKEFKLAKNETILLLIILLLLCGLYFIYPIIYKNFAYRNSTLLLNKPKDLNYITELGHTKDLKIHKESKNPFKKTYKKKKIYSKKTLETKNELDNIDEEITELCWDLSANNIPYTFKLNSGLQPVACGINDWKEATLKSKQVDTTCNKLLNLTDPSYSIMTVNYYNESDIQYKEMKCKMYDLHSKKDKLTAYYEESLKKDLEDKESDKDEDKGNNKKVINKIINNYSISFWLYIEPTQENINNYWTNIINFGDKIKVSYNMIGTNQNMLEFKILNDDNEYEVIYVHANIKSQSWNNFVLIYNDLIMDIFLNAKLVSSNDNIKISRENSKIIIGENNGIRGSLCNFFYYYGNIDINKIKENYKNLINKNPPII